MKNYEQVKRQLNKMGISDYSVRTWLKFGDYDKLFGFLTAMANVAIINDDMEANDVFYNASRECIEKL